MLHMEQLHHVSVFYNDREKEGNLIEFILQLQQYLNQSWQANRRQHLSPLRHPLNPQ